MKAGWETRAIASFAQTGAGGTPTKSNKAFYEDGSIPWLVSGEVANANIMSTKNFITSEGLKGSSAKLFPANSVLVAMYGATAGEVGLLRFQAATNQAVCAVLPSDQHIPEYLYYCLLHLKPSLVAQAVGNAQPNISQAKIKSLEIPLPPLEEQQRIVAVLDEAFEGLARAREHAEVNLRNARELYRASLTALTFRSVGAEEVALAEATASGSSITYGVVKPGPEGEIPFVRGGDLRDGRIDIDALRTITKEVSETYQRTKLRGGELLLCLVGQPGQTGVVPDGLIGANIARQTALIRLSNEFDTEFVSFFLLSDEGQSRLGAYTQGAIQQVINLKELKTVLIPLLPIEIQKEIAAKCNNLRWLTSDAERSYEKKLNDIDDLRQSLLQKAFAGELT